MKNYESPTIEPAGGTGNKVQPEAWIPIFFVLAIVVLDYVVAAQILLVTELVGNFSGSSSHYRHVYHLFCGLRFARRFYFRVSRGEIYEECFLCR